MNWAFVIFMTNGMVCGLVNSIAKVSFLSLITVLWLYKMVTDGKMSEGYLGTLYYFYNISVNWKLSSKKAM